jgi:ribosomal protein S18 acetylase RimI-like enzyme
MIRPAAPSEASVLRDVELASGQLFREHGLGHLADDEPLWLDDWETYQQTGLAWVAERDDAVVGFLLAEVLDEALHIEQVSVLPSHGRQGIGTALVERACREAAARGYASVTLSTFRDVPFNAPLYRRLGFRDLTDAELTPGLRARRDHETASGLDPTTRVMMRRALVNA